MESDELFEDTDRILDDEWYDEIYPTLYARINMIEPNLVQECAEMSRNTEQYVFAVREFTRSHFSQYMAKTPIVEEGVELDTEVRSARDEPIYNKNGVRTNNPFLVDVDEIPEVIKIKTEHGEADFSRREIFAMIRHSSPMS